MGAQNPSMRVMALCRQLGNQLGCHHLISVLRLAELHSSDPRKRLSVYF
jgi:hypothetical protein